MVFNGFDEKLSQTLHKIEVISYCKLSKFGDIKI